MHYHPPTIPGPILAPGSDNPGKVLAIVGIVFAAPGLLFFPFALVGLVLGIVALVRSIKGTSGKTMAVVATCLSGAALVVGMCSLGVLLPALGKARQSARQIKSSTQLRGIGQAMILYQQNFKEYPPATGWDNLLVNQGFFSKDLLVAPHAPSGTTTPSYIYIYRSASKQYDLNKTLWMYEDPAHHSRTHVYNVMFMDNAVRAVKKDEFLQHLGTTTDDTGNPIPIPVLPN